MQQVSLPMSEPYSLSIERVDTLHLDLPQQLPHAARAASIPAARALALHSQSPHAHDSGRLTLREPEEHHLNLQASCAPGRRAAHSPGAPTGLETALIV